MDDEAIKLLLAKVKDGDKAALEKLESHLQAVRGLLAELADGLDDGNLLCLEVDEVLNGEDMGGWSCEDEDEDMNDEDDEDDEDEDE